MAKERESVSEDINPQTAALIAALASSIAGIAPKPEIKEGDPEYVARQRAEGWYDDFFGKKIFQNAYEANPRGLSEEVRKRASQLTAGAVTLRKGRKVGIFVNGNDITLAYPIKGDAGLINQQHWADFPDLINQLWEAQNAPVPAA
jgi:hypothetical protein